MCILHYYKFLTRYRLDFNACSSIARGRPSAFKKIHASLYGTWLSLQDEGVAVLSTTPIEPGI
jgi:hypothetical protein